MTYVVRSETPSVEVVPDTKLKHPVGQAGVRDHLGEDERAERRNLRALEARRCIRTLSLNLAIQDGRVLSMPVATQDALVSRNGSLSVVEVPARGELTLGDHRLHWAGSRTPFTADCYVYGNANSVILHQPDERTGKIRVFQEESRFTPKILNNGWSDLGFTATADGWQHLCLFDGRPGSPTFPGLTLDQAISTVSARGDLVSGCLLDSGNTSKLNVVRSSRLETFGNRHYVRWPSPSEPRFTWNPDQGRPVASVVALY